ncbi:MAG: hypothetical protein AMJ63_12355 [Myxococcales bacterium SG8_38_1]|nr:MAG: hypothetical protein AMJ63_12355 [Myxococcales bacterium SG8_38_1]
MTRWTALLTCAFLLASCRNNANNVVLASLDRTEKIDLVCARIDDVGGNRYEFYGALPLDLCKEDPESRDGPQPQLLGEVTQTESGTLAVVNFLNGAVFNTNITVPGVTALRVGEQPTGVQVSDVDARYTYVSSFSPKSVQAISTREVITGSADAFERQEVRFNAGPTDLVLHEEATFEEIEDEGEVVGATTTVRYRYLYVALPELGQVAQIQIVIDNATGRQAFGTITELQLPTYTCETVAAVPPPVSDVTDYHRICPEDFDNRGEGRYVKDVTTTLPCTDGTGSGPMPVALAIDPADPENLFDDILLVADANQPVIHRFGVWENGATTQEPIVTLAPTTDIDVTPFVPATSAEDDRDATQRYLYAIGAREGSVLAVDYTPGSASYGAVLPVIAGQSPRANEENVESRNRVRSAFSNARSIEVITPFYELGPDLRIPEGDPETDICDPNDPDSASLAQNPRNMRGVFLAVSLSNGTIYFLDVYDLNAPCRGGQGNTACTLAETGSDQFASIRRHRKRFGFTPSTFIEIDGAPSVQFNAAPGVLDETTGLPKNSDGPGLEFIDCPESHFNVFGVPPQESTADGLICASSQVWSSFSQRWDARWQGLIPGSEGGLGLFSDESFEGEPGNWFLAGDVPFCRIGVLGEQSGTQAGNGLSVDALETYGGDRLVITGELPPNTKDDEACKQEFEDLLEDIDDRQVWFPIIDAFNDQLEIGPSPRGSAYTDLVKRCFNQYTEYQIHTRDAYTVTGSTSGFINRVIPDDTQDGLCIFDPDRPVDLPASADDTFDVDTYLTGRAFPGTQFINPMVSFQISDFGPTTNPTDSTVVLASFAILNQFSIELLDTGGGTVRSLPASMLFSPLRDELYFVDFEAGVKRVVFSPLSIVQTFD